MYRVDLATVRVDLDLRKRGRSVSLIYLYAMWNWALFEFAINLFWRFCLFLGVWSLFWWRQYSSWSVEYSNLCRWIYETNNKNRHATMHNNIFQIYLGFLSCCCVIFFDLLLLLLSIAIAKSISPSQLASYNIARSRSLIMSTAPLPQISDLKISPKVVCLHVHCKIH